MVNIWWYWPRGKDAAGKNTDEFRELVIDFTIHNDPGSLSHISQRNGLYLMVCQGSISGHDFYFGLQTNTRDPQRGGRGRGAIFSRWGERDLSYARIADANEGWTESAGYEGDFISVRRTFAWGTGDYRMRIAADGHDANGEWYSLWITDLSTNRATRVGSLKFPLVAGTTAIMGRTYSTLEIYGPPIRPIDIPEWHVSLRRPVGDGVRPDRGITGYDGFKRGIQNSDVQYDRQADLLHFRVGGTTVRTRTAEQIDAK